MANISARKGMIKQGAVAVAETRSELTQRIGRLEGDLGNVGASWQGDAQQAFTQLMIRWQEGARKTINALEHFEDSLTRTEQKFAETDTEQSDKFSKLGLT